MSKWYEVEVQTLVVYVVEVPEGQNELHAQNMALVDFDSHRRATATALPIPLEHVEKARKNADRVRLLDGWDGKESEDE